MTLPDAAQQSLLVVEDDGALRLALTTLLQGAGYQVAGAADGAEALQILEHRAVDLLLVDVGLPRVGGLEVLEQARKLNATLRAVVMTADDTPETLLRAVRDQVYAYVKKPFPPNTIVEVVQKALAASPASLPIEVVSAIPEWVELLVPCALDVAQRMQAFMMQLDANLPEPVRESVGYAFREMLCNAIEWGGKLDPTRKVRISCMRFRRMLVYRIADPGQGFSMDSLTHSAVNNPAESPFQHALVRDEKGIRPGGFGIFLVREMVDELLYNESRNEVVFVKYLE